MPIEFFNFLILKEIGEGAGENVLPILKKN